MFLTNKPLTTGNKLSEVKELGLEGLHNLQVLDLSNNAIKTAIPVIAQFVDSLSSLQILAIRNNPVMKTKEDRLKLIGFIPSMKQICPLLTVVDTPITIREKIEGLVEFGSVPPKEAEDLRLQATVAQKVPVGVVSTQVTKLDFSFCGLKGFNCLLLLLFFSFSNSQQKQLV